MSVKLEKEVKELTEALRFLGMKVQSQGAAIDRFYRDYAAMEREIENLRTKTLNSCKGACGCNRAKVYDFKDTFIVLAQPINTD